MDCAVDGCLGQAFTKGLCGKHYHEDRKLNAPRCKLDGCASHVHGRGLCEAHYREFVRKKNKPCSIDGCGRPTVAKGLCDSHRKRRDRHGHIKMTRSVDWGAKAKHPLYQLWKWKRRSNGAGDMAAQWYGDFWRFVSDIGERPAPDLKLLKKVGHLPLGPANFRWASPRIMIDAEGDKKEYNRQFQRAYRDQNPDKYAHYSFKARYGLDHGTYNLIATSQGNVCAICKMPESAASPRNGQPRKLAVDHCHTGGHIRALLCSKCNTGLGSFRDNPSLLRAAAAYLEHHALQEDAT